MACTACAWRTRSLCLHLILRLRQASHATRLGPSTLVLGVLRCVAGNPPIIIAWAGIIIVAVAVGAFIDAGAEGG